MSGKQRNPFDDDDDCGGFGQQPIKSSGYGGDYSGSTGGVGQYGRPGFGAGGGFSQSASIDQDIYSPQAQLQAAQQRSADSQVRALQSLCRSEQLGVDTAKELLDQGEKLDRAERKVDEIEEMQKDSQRSINSLSSLFGGLKNVFSKKPREPEKPAASTSSQGSRNPELKAAMTSSTVMQSQQQRYQEDSQFGGPPKRGQGEFENNLGLMSDGLGRLKGLAQNMGNEIERQNTQLDRLTPKVDNVNATMQTQNRQLNILLHGKPK